MGPLFSRALNSSNVRNIVFLNARLHIRKEILSFCFVQGEEGDVVVVGLRRRQEELREEGEERDGAEGGGDLPGEAAAGVPRGGRRRLPALPDLLPAAATGVVRATTRGESARPRTDC